MSQDEQELIALLAHFYLQNARAEKGALLLAALDAVAGKQPAILGALAFAQLRAGHGRQALETLNRLAMDGELDASFHLLRTLALAKLERGDEAEDSMLNYLDLRQTAPAPARDPELTEA